MDGLGFEERGKPESIFRLHQSNLDSGFRPLPSGESFVLASEPQTRHSSEGWNPVWNACGAHKNNRLGVLRTTFSLDPSLRWDDERLDWRHSQNASFVQAKP